MNVIYILGDTEHPEMIKIGYDSNWPAISEQAKKTIRFEQARSHNPRGVTVHGLWSFGTTEEMKATERKIHSMLQQFQRIDTHGREWFNIGFQDAAAKIISAGLVTSAALQDPSPRTRNREMPYDDWREPSELYKGEVYKRLLWVFQEDGPQKRLKVIHSPLFDTCYKYAFTYNPFHVHLVAAFHHPLFPAGPSSEMSKGNAHVESCWRQIVADKTHGPGLEATNVGWLNKGATLEWVGNQALASGLVAYDLFQPKPGCVRPQDPQIPAIPVGGNWLKRVRQ